MKKLCLLLVVVFCLPFTLLFSACGGEEEGGVSYEITAEYIPESSSLFGTLKCRYQNKTDTLKDSLCFELYPNAYRKDAIYQPVSTAYHSAAYYDGESYGELVITSVLGGKGWQVCGEDKNILKVELEEPLAEGEEVVVDISFVTQLAKVNHRTGESEYAVNLGNFYPILCADMGQGFVEVPYYSVGDPFLSACADYKVTLKLPKDYVVAATGVLKEEKTLESKKACVFEAKKVRDFALVLSTRFQLVEKKVGKTSVKYYFVDDSRATENLTLAAEAITYYSSAFGEYPYETYSVVQTGFCLGGMEYPALVMISAALAERENRCAIVHETAHQWWYAAVGSDQVNEAWQDEGLTEYSTALFFEKHPKYGLTREGFVQGSLTACRAYNQVYGSIFGEGGGMSKRLDEYISDYAYRVLAYDKGVVMFDNLRRSVGDKKFFTALKKYYTDGTYKMVQKGALIGAFEKAGVDAGGLIESFLQGKVAI